MATFEERAGRLYIDGREVLRGWESFSGWFWFATTRERTQDSVMADGCLVRNDTIWFGFVQGLFEEWGSFSQAELDDARAAGWVREIPQRNLPYAGRRT